MKVPDRVLSGSQLPEIDPFDPRLNVIRPDLADARLQNKVEAETYVTGEPATVITPVVDIKGSTDPDSNTTHQLLLGEKVMVYEEAKEKKWIQSTSDSYVGYVSSDTIKAAEGISLSSSQSSAPDAVSHIVCVPVTFCYPNAELRNPPICSLSIGSRVTVSTYESVRGIKYALLEEGGAIIDKHLREIEDYPSDFVKVCELLINVPYLWGGASGFGIDCSSLVQLSMRMCGRQVLRDSDMQAATIGMEIDAGNNYQELLRGDLIFWRGHVAVHQGDIEGVAHIIHASGHTMNVASEPLHQAIERIDYLYEKPIGFRRPDGL